MFTSPKTAESKTLLPLKQLSNASLERDDSISLSPDTGAFLTHPVAQCSQTLTMYVLNTRTGELLNQSEWPRSNGFQGQLCAMPGRKNECIVAPEGGWGDKIVIYNYVTKATREHHFKCQSKLIYSPLQGGLVAGVSLTDASQICIYDLETQKTQTIKVSHFSGLSIHQLQFVNPDWLVVRASDVDTGHGYECGALRISSLENKPENTYQRLTNEPMNHMLISPDGSILAALVPGVVSARRRSINALPAIGWNIKLWNRGQNGLLAPEPKVVSDADGKPILLKKSSENLYAYSESGLMFLGFDVEHNVYPLYRVDPHDFSVMQIPGIQCSRIRALQGGQLLMSTEGVGCSVLDIEKRLAELRSTTREDARYLSVLSLFDVTSLPRPVRNLVGDYVAEPWTFMNLK